ASTAAAGGRARSASESGSALRGARDARHERHERDLAGDADANTLPAGAEAAVHVEERVSADELPRVEAGLEQAGGVEPWRARHRHLPAVRVPREGQPDARGGGRIEDR